MPKLTYTAAKGLVQEAGSGISFESTPFSPAQVVTNDATITTPGVYVLSSSDGTGANAFTLPSVSAYPGANFVFRLGSNDASYLTGSGADQAPVFTGRQLAAPGTMTAKVGSKLAFTGISGQSVILVSDGLRYCVVGGSGSFTLSETLPA